MKIGILTGGGDTSSLNAILYGVAIQSERFGHELLGFRKGWQGVLDLDYISLASAQINPQEGGTLLRTSRTNPNGQTLEMVAVNIEKKVDALIAIGGDDTLTVGRRLTERLAIPICFVTKTIDNDVGRNAPEGELDYSKIVNYFTSGFATASKRVAEYASHLRTTAYSHERVIFLETMGRFPGWLALSSYRGEPDFILVPEVPLDFERFKQQLAKRYEQEGHVVAVVAEGVRYVYSDRPISEDESNIDVFGHRKLGGVAQILAERVKKELGIKNSNYVNPNYLYRCGPPTDLDRETAVELGTTALTAVHEQRTGEVVVIQRVNDSLIADTKPIDEVLLVDAKEHIIPRNLDLRFYDPATYSITSVGREYFRIMK